MKQLLSLVALVFLLASCHVNYDKTKSGLVYKIFKGKGGESLHSGKFVKLDVEYKLDGKDSILNSTYGKIPVFGVVDTSSRYAYSYMELLPRLQVGDSAEFVISIDTLKSRNLIPDYNEVFKKGRNIKCRLHILKAYNNEADIKADYDKEIALESEREVKELEALVAKKGIKTQKSKNGVLVEIETPGDAANKGDTGKVVSVLYKGYLVDGKVFDTNLDSSKGHTGAYDVTLGQSPVIQGWQEGLPFFGKGGKGKLYIPAMLGYGMKGMQGAIPPYANLIFDVEITDVKTAPPAAPQQQNPYGNLTPQQLQQLQQQMQQKQQQSQQQHK